jgi:hypothetical protein
MDANPVCNAKSNELLDPLTDCHQQSIGESVGARISHPHANTHHLRSADAVANFYADRTPSRSSSPSASSSSRSRLGHTRFADTRPSKSQPYCDHARHRNLNAHCHKHATCR